MLFRYLSASFFLKMHPKSLTVLLAILCCGLNGFAQVSVNSLTVGSKLSPTMAESLSKNSTNFSVMVLLNDTATFTALSQTFHLEQVQAFTFGTVATLHGISKNQIADLAEMPGVLHMEAIRPPKPEAIVANLDISLNHIQQLHHRWPQISGDGLTLSIKEERFDTNDIDLRGRALVSEFSFAETNQHASFMATVAGGGGNSGPGSMGVAPAVGLSSASFENLLPTPSAYFASQNITAQNHSYGTAIENYYGIETAAYDDHCRANSSIVHVFSAGNAGQGAATSGKYANLPGLANLTGQFKQSKNTISVGATDSLGMPLDISSHGPAHDGRIKPELMAFGLGGSSEAAALVSGTVMAMQQAFALSNGGQLPPSSLVRAILANTANDAGRPNPDYETGFGNLDAERCVATIFEGKYLTDSLMAGGLKTFLINVPPNTALLKATLVWNDPAAGIGSQTALVNDLDLELANQTTGEAWLPWTLNPFPHPDSLRLPAQRNLDTLNNLEQITLDLPAVGLYILRVKGAADLIGSQAFSLTWQMDSLGTFEWVSPVAAGNFPPSTNVILRWEGRLPSLTGNISYRFIGEEWQPVSDSASLANGFFKHWRTPDRTGLAQLKMETTEGSFLSDSFLIAPQLRPKVGFDCSDSLLIYWKKMPEASSYQVFELGPRYLELLAETTDTFFIQDAVGKAASQHYAVAPMIAGRVGPLCNTFDYTKQGVGCYLKAFYFNYKENGKAKFTASVGTLHGLASAVLERQFDSGFAPAQVISPLDSTTFGFEGVPLTDGVNYFKLKLVLQNSGEIFSETIAVYNVESDAYLLYPNPVSGGRPVNLLSKSDLIAAYQLLDMQGRLVWSSELDDQPTFLDTSGLSKGCYTVRVTDEQGGRWAGRLVIL